MVKEISNSALLQYGKISLSQQWVDWSMPTLTSNSTTVSEGTISVSICITNANAYKIWNGTSNTTTIQCSKPYWTMITFPYNIKITAITIKNGTYSPGAYYALTECAVYTSSTKTTQIGSTVTGMASGTSNYIFSIPNIPSTGVITNCVYVCGPADGTNILGVSLTAKKLTSTLNSITFPTSYTSSNSYGASFSYINGSSASAYISSRTSTGLSLNGVDMSSTSASWITVGY